MKAETIRMMMSNQLPENQFIRFAHMGEIKGKGLGLAGAITLTPSSIDPPNSTGEFQ